MSALHRVLERLENVHEEGEGYKASCLRSLPTGKVAATKTLA